LKPIVASRLAAGKDRGDAVKAGPLRVGAYKSEPGRADAVERVQAWTRARFNLPAEAAVLATELVCTRPGCPPLETVVAFWVEDGQRRHFKLFKPIAEVGPDDLPPAWLMDALCAEPADDEACC
jgi:nitrate reductase delta subunit